MSTAGFILFFFSAITALIGAVATVTARRPLRAAMGLLVNVIALAALYLTLHAELLAVLQLLVYAGAVVVLFVFVILLIGPAGEVPSSTHALVSRTLAGVTAGAIMLLTAFSLVREEAAFSATPSDYGTVENLGIALYDVARAPFEMVSITLLVAVVGAVAIARARTAGEKAEAKADTEARKLAAAAEASGSH